MIGRLRCLLAHVIAVCAAIAICQSCHNLSRTDRVDIEHLMAQMDQEIFADNRASALLDGSESHLADREQLSRELIAQWGKRTAYYDFNLIRCLPGSTQSLAVRRSLAARLAKEPELCRQWFLYPAMRPSVGPLGFHQIWDGFGPDDVKAIWQDAKDSYERGEYLLMLLHLAGAMDRTDIFAGHPDFADDGGRAELAKLLDWIESHDFNFYYHRCSASFQLAVKPSECESCKEQPQDPRKVFGREHEKPRSEAERSARGEHEPDD